MDRAGNSSTGAVAALVNVDGTGPGSASPWLLAGAGAVALLALGVGGYVHLRRHLRRTARVARGLVQAGLPVILPAPKGRHARH